jgi:hypothetical protein
LRGRYALARLDLARIKFLKLWLAAPTKCEAGAFCVDINCPSIGQPRESCPVDKNESQRFFVDQNVDDGAADAKRADGCLDLVAAGLLHAGDEAERALGRIEHDLAGALRGIKHVFVERNLRTGADAQAGLIAKKQLRIAVGVGAHGLVGEQLAADG